jgi:hypothetical protein
MLEDAVLEALFSNHEGITVPFEYVNNIFVRFVLS